MQGPSWLPFEPQGPQLQVWCLWVLLGLSGIPSEPLGLSCCSLSLPVSTYSLQNSSEKQSGSFPSRMYRSPDWRRHMEYCFWWLRFYGATIFGNRNQSAFHGTWTAAVGDTLVRARLRAAFSFHITTCFGGDGLELVLLAFLCTTGHSATAAVVVSSKAG